jgi:hypothetical protein
VNLSVVGSGPTRIPGKSRPSKYLTNDVLPEEKKKTKQS